MTPHTLDLVCSERLGNMPTDRAGTGHTHLKEQAGVGGGSTDKYREVKSIRVGRLAAGTACSTVAAGLDCGPVPLLPTGPHHHHCTLHRQTEAMALLHSPRVDTALLELRDVLLPVKPVPGLQCRAVPGRRKSMAALITGPASPSPDSRWLGMVMCWKVTRNLLVGSPRTRSES